MVVFLRFLCVSFSFNKQFSPTLSRLAILYRQKSETRNEFLFPRRVFRTADRVAKFPVNFSAFFHTLRELAMVKQLGVDMNELACLYTGNRKIARGMKNIWLTQTLELATQQMLFSNFPFAVVFWCR